MAGLRSRIGTLALALCAIAAFALPASAAADDLLAGPAARAEPTVAAATSHAAAVAAPPALARQGQPAPPAVPARAEAVTRTQGSVPSLVRAKSAVPPRTATKTVAASQPVAGAARGSGPPTALRKPSGGAGRRAIGSAAESRHFDSSARGLGDVLAGALQALSRVVVLASLDQLVPVMATLPTLTGRAAQPLQAAEPRAFARGFVLDGLGGEVTVAALPSGADRSAASRRESAAGAPTDAGHVVKRSPAGRPAALPARDHALVLGFAVERRRHRRDGLRLGRLRGRPDPLSARGSSPRPCGSDPGAFTARAGIRIPIRASRLALSG
jgi:hypothetical protein